MKKVMRPASSAEQCFCAWPSDAVSQAFPRGTAVGDAHIIDAAPGRRPLPLDARLAGFPRGRDRGQFLGFLARWAKITK